MRVFNPRGSAIFLAMIMMVGALAILMGVLASSTNNVVKHDQYSGREATYFAAEGVISQAWGRMYNPIAMQLYTDQGIYNYLTGVDPNSPYRGSFSMPILNGSAADMNTSVDSTIESDWVALPNLDAPQGNPVIAYTNAGFKFGSAYIVDVKARWRRDVNILADSTKKTTWTITVRATAQNKWSSANPSWYDETDPPAVVAQTFQFTQANKSTVLNYVNLARNVSCTLCHTQFQDVLNAFNNNAIAKITDPTNSNTTPAATAVATKLEQQYGTYPKVKLGTLGNFQVRDLNTVDPTLNGRFYPSDSILDGTLYSRGIIQDNEHNALSDVPQAAMMARQFDSVNQDNIYQDKTSGAENTVPMAPAGYGPDGNPLPHQNLYLNYPNSNTVNAVSGGTMTQSDGVMPDDFPYPFDPNVPSSLPGYTAQQLATSQTNRLVDGPKVDNWIKQRTDPVATSDASNPNRLGTMSGGYAMVVDNSGNIVSATNNGTTPSIYNSTKLPDATVSAGVPVDTRLKPSDDANVGGASGIVNGNLVLIGTKDNPVNLSAQVLVKGDVIVKGYYSGVGSMWATGNIYLPSDLRYDDSSMKDANGNAILDANGNPLEDFGNLNNTAKGENLGGMIAGGTIVIGDYLTSSLSAAPNTSSYTTNLPPDTNGQRENSFPLVPTYQKADPTFTYNYRDLNTSNGTYNVSQQQLYAKNFTLSEMELFNRDEWGHTQQSLPNGTNGNYDVPNSQYGQFDPVKGTYDPTQPYMPRYYVLNPGDPVGAFVYGSQSTNPAQMATDAANRVGTEGSYWSNGSATEPPMWKGGEMSKVYNTTTIGGDPSQAGNGSIVNGNATHLVYGANNNTLVDSTDPSGTQKAAVIAINPQWLGATPDQSTQTMWSYLLNEEWDRKFNTASSQAVYGSTTDASAAVSARDGTPFRLDGLFYTNNAIFGIQRNRALAPQAAGDYNDVNGPITSGPQAPDPTKPGSWQTPVPTMSYQYDNYQGTAVYDTYTKDLLTDHYLRTPYKDNYQETQYYDTYSRTAYTDNYSGTFYTDTYQRTPYTDNYSQQVTTATWTLYTGSGYSREGPFTVTQTSPPGTISQPTTAPNGKPVTQASDTTSQSTSTSSSAVYYNAGSPPAVPAGWTKSGTSTGTVQTSTSAKYSAGHQPSVPATYTLQGTTSAVLTKVSAVYYDAALPPTVPAGYSKTSTTIGATSNTQSGNYTTTEPSVPAGYTKTGTVTVNATSSSASYYDPSNPPAVPAGWTKTGTTTGTAQQVASAAYRAGSEPGMPAGYSMDTAHYSPNGTTSAVTTTRQPAATATPNYYMQGATPPPPPAGYIAADKTGTVTVGTETTQVPYGSTPPPGFTTKLPPTNPIYAYPGDTNGKNASDFKRYAKEMTSSSQGIMVVNGALVAPDLGLLVTGRKSAQNPYTLIMNYDQRVRRLVQFVSNTPDTKWNLVIKGWTRLNVGAANQ